MRELISKRNWSQLIFMRSTLPILLTSMKNRVRTKTVDSVADSKRETLKVNVQAKARFGRRSGSFVRFNPQRRCLRSCANFHPPGDRFVDSPTNVKTLQAREKIRFQHNSFRLLPVQNFLLN